MKNSIQTVALFLILSLGVKAQEVKETIEPLTKKSIKGYVYDVHKDDRGTCHITYKIKGDKGSDEVFYEEYSFDKDLKFLGNKDVQEKKVAYEDYESTKFYAFVGGTTSFDVLSMKLKLRKTVALRTWNHEKQVFITKKYISNEVIKPRNDDGKVYLGYASYSAHEDDKSNVFIIAKAESKDKEQAENFYILLFNENMEIKEKELGLNGKYSLVFSHHLVNNDIVAVFAPKKGNGDPSDYVYFQFDIEGNIKSKINFKSPASALLISAAYEDNGAIYFFGSSTKSQDSFEDVFNEYAPIYNPGSVEAGMNRLDIKWRKSLEGKMDNFHLLKFDANKLDFASTTAIDDFKSKFKAAPGEKGATAYKGKKFSISNFFVVPNGDYLVAGQLTSTVSMGTGNIVDSYEDIVCFHFDSKGNLKSQYGLGKINNDKKSEIFSMVQDFYISADGKHLYWEVFEVKGVKGYEGFMDAYNGQASFYPLYYPRLGKIDLNNATVSSFKSVGEGKYFLRRDFTSNFDAAENSITYIGHDDKFKNLWVGKMMLE